MDSELIARQHRVCVGTEPIERDESQVEQTAVPHDEVQAQG